MKKKKEQEPQTSMLFCVICCEYKKNQVRKWVYTYRSVSKQACGQPQAVGDHRPNNKISTRPKRTLIHLQDNLP